MFFPLTWDTRVSVWWDLRNLFQKELRKICASHKRNFFSVQKPNVITLSLKFLCRRTIGVNEGYRGCFLNIDCDLVFVLPKVVVSLRKIKSEYAFCCSKVYSIYVALIFSPHSKTQTRTNLFRIQIKAIYLGFGNIIRKFLQYN